MIITSVMMIIIEVADVRAGQYVVDRTTKSRRGHTGTTYNTILGLCRRIFHQLSCPRPYELDYTRIL